MFHFQHHCNCNAGSLHYRFITYAPLPTSATPRSPSPLPSQSLHGWHELLSSIKWTTLANPMTDTSVLWCQSVPVPRTAPFSLAQRIRTQRAGLIFSHVREVKGRKVVKRTSLSVSALGLRRAKRAFCSESFFSHRHWPNTSACCYTFYGQVVATSKYGVWTLGTLNRDVWINQVFE